MAQMRIVGVSQYVKRVGKMIPRLAAGKEDVLVLGEVGSGRRTVAWEIHNARGRKRPYVLVNCRAITDEEFRASLAGQQVEVAEAIVGRKPPTVQDQATATIADADLLAPHNQELFVRFLREGRKRYSGTKIIATLGQSPVRLAQGGKMLRELADLLDKFTLVEVPALRERLEDIPLLAQSITTTLCASFGLPPKRLDDNLCHILSQGQWPGNVQQLAAVLGKAVLHSEGDALELPSDFLDEHQHLEDAIANISTGVSFVLDRSLDLIEKLLIQRGLKQYLYNQSRTAQIFGLSEANFRYRLKKFGLPSIRKKA